MSDMSKLPTGNGTIELLSWAYQATKDAEFEWARMEVASVYQPWSRNSNSPERIEHALKHARMLVSEARRKAKVSDAEG